MILDGFEYVDLGPDGGPYDDTSRPKLGWHTWEGLSWSSAESAFRKYPPHLAVFPPWEGYEDRVGKRQYISLDRHAYAFAGSESDDEYVIQVEVAGYAAEMRYASGQVLRWLAEEVVRPLEAAVGIPPIVIPIGFHDATEGIVPYLATTESPIRISQGELRAFSGHLGHQHMPPPDTHWDPGALPIDRILAFAGDDQEDNMPSLDEIRVVVSEEVDRAVQATLRQPVGSVHVWPDGCSPYIGKYIVDGDGDVVQDTWTGSTWHRTRLYDNKSATGPAIPGSVEVLPNLLDQAGHVFVSALLAEGGWVEIVFDPSTGEWRDAVAHR